LLESGILVADPITDLIP